LDPKLTYVAKITFNYGSPSYYICRRYSSHNWEFSNIIYTKEVCVDHIGGGIAQQRYLQNSCQHMLDIRSSSLTISLWQFSSWEEFVECKQNNSI